MKTLYLELGMGAAGDMLSAALYELLDDEKKREYVERMNSLGLEGVSVFAEPAEKCGIKGTHMRVAVDGLEEHEHHHDHEHEHEHVHEHEHEHHHEHEHTHEHDHEHEHHHHSGVAEINALIDGAAVSEGVKRSAKEVYSLIAAAESHAHGRPIEEIHFHEVGTKDAAADVIGCCLLMEMIGAEKIIASPAATGWGAVHCAHGILPVPAPATAFIMQGAPTYAGRIEGELLTPTGAALIRHFVSEFREMPPMTVEKTGYGMGTKDFPRANCVRAMLGEEYAEFAPNERVTELACNIDDMTGEAIGFAQEMLFDAGAVDVWTENIGMKKSRPGVKLCAICRENRKDAVVKAFFRHTSTIGLREYVCGRYAMERTIEKKPVQDTEVAVKFSSGFGFLKNKAEFEDISRIARQKGISLTQALELAKKQ